MASKDKMVDFPGYDPAAKVPFPPGKEPSSPFGKKSGRKQEDDSQKQPYYESYTPDPPTPDPSQTSPGMPDLRDPDTRLPENADLDALSPDVDLKK